jgi:two-component system cell cycle response regulator DivK
LIPFFQLASRLYENAGLDANLLGNREQVRLMRLQETQHFGEQRRVGRSGAELISPDSGQIEEPLRPAFGTKRCRKRGERKSERIVWTRALQHVDTARRAKGRELARILIVEDNALNIKLFCDLLAAHGHQPEAVTDSRNALDAARQFAPDLVITDIQLPHVSGLDLIRMIRKDEQLSQVPIMAVTAYSARGDEERIRAAGAQAYVSKPISVVKFAQTVDELLTPASAGDATGKAPQRQANESTQSPDPSEPGAEE